MWYLYTKETKWQYRVRVDYMKKTRKVLTALLLAVVMIASLIPLAAFAAEIQGGKPALAVNSTAQTVSFAGHEWYVIGTKSSGGAANGITYTGMPSDSAILLVKGGTPYGTVLFNLGDYGSDPSQSFNYNGGPLHTAMSSACGR